MVVSKYGRVQIAITTLCIYGYPRRARGTIRRRKKIAPPVVVAQTGLTESETSLGRFGFRFLRNRNTLQLLGSRRHVDRRLLCLVEQGLEGMTVFMFDFLPLGEQSGMPSEKFEDLGACCPGLCLLRLLEQVFHLLEHSIC